MEAALSPAPQGSACSRAPWDEKPSRIVEAAGAAGCGHPSPGAAWLSLPLLAPQSSKYLRLPAAKSRARAKGHRTAASAIWKTPGACVWEHREDPRGDAAALIPAQLGGELLCAQPLELHGGEASLVERMSCGASHVVRWIRAFPLPCAGQALQPLLPGTRQGSSLLPQHKGAEDEPVSFPLLFRRRGTALVTRLQPPPYVLPLVQFRSVWAAANGLHLCLSVESGSVRRGRCVCSESLGWLSLFSPDRIVSGAASAGMCRTAEIGLLKQSDGFECQLVTSTDLNEIMRIPPQKALCRGCHHAAALRHHWAGPALLGKVLAHQAGCPEFLSQSTAVALRKKEEIGPEHTDLLTGAAAGGDVAWSSSRCRTIPLAPQPTSEPSLE
ncbi:hypothetical protein Anapl_12135 [Anas platyrhynchos]|uniref:Uncharacterized protein n=1 Tax=Anas platyrhynchos TaxID=8839 RepID=R0JQW4_ANAPL|nr:hypothetical protein Anapl_12135 [Anas platyrhynchos]